MAPVDISSFATSQLSLLDDELQAELAETSELADQTAPNALQRAGLAVLNLHIASQRTGLGGRTVLDLELDPAIGRTEIPENGFRVGDIVGLREQLKGAAKRKEKSEAEKKSVDGVVIKTTDSVIAVALDREEAEAPSGKLWIVKLASDITYKRMSQTMTRLQTLKAAEQTPLMRVLFGQNSPTKVTEDTELLEQQTGDIAWNNLDLNSSQQSAVRFALASPEIALIHGPPGTGKTQTLIELILQILHHRKLNEKKPLRLLVCGPSNVSVDNIVERLAPHGVPMVRLGHPARLHPAVVNHSLDVLTKTSDAAQLVSDVRREMDAKQTAIRKTRTGRERREIYGELRELRREYRERERGCVTQLVRSSRVVLATLHGAGGHQLKDEEFDLVIIDEASQALEAQCWVPLVTAKKAVLAGDHLQLPPTVKSLNLKSSASKGSAAAAATKTTKPKETKVSETASTSKKSPSRAATLETTLFDRLLTLHGPGIKRMLTTQYRMHESIMAYPSAALYDKRLVAAPSVASRLLTDLKVDPPVQDTDDTREPLIFYDTQGGDFPEALDDDTDMARLRESKSNPNEAAIVASHVRRLTEAGVPASCIAVIAPYTAQVALLARLLRRRYPALELGSVDGFQGRERECVVLSLVRSNTEREIGFLGEERRLNVAMTRARRQLVVVGDGETVGRGGGKFLKKWMAHLEECADVRYPDVGEVMMEGAGDDAVDA